MKSLIPLNDLNQKPKKDLIYNCYKKHEFWHGIPEKVLF